MRIINRSHRCQRRCRGACAVTAVAVLDLLASSGCARVRSTQAHVTTDLRSAVCQRVHRNFAKAVFLKPSESQQIDWHAMSFGPLAGIEPSYLAPLFVLELGGGAQSQPRSAKPGQLVATVDGGFLVETDRPTVYFDSTTVRLKDHAFDQIRFLWFHESRDEAARAEPLWRLVRMTCDGQGNPLIFEVCSSDEPLTIVYVSRSLEARAASRFGPPLEGRRFSIESDISRHPEVVVARVLDDAPEPMGPIVYLDAQRQQVSTLICRCMPAQVNEFVETAYYEAMPVDSLPDAVISRVTGERGTAAALNEILRLPDLVNED